MRLFKLILQFTLAAMLITLSHSGFAWEYDYTVRLLDFKKQESQPDHHHQPKLVAVMMIDDIEQLLDHNPTDPQLQLNIQVTNLADSSQDSIIESYQLPATILTANIIEEVAYQQTFAIGKAQEKQVLVFVDPLSQRIKIEYHQWLAQRDQFHYQLEMQLDFQQNPTLDSLYGAGSIAAGIRF